MSRYRDEVVSNLAYGRQKMTELGRTLMMEPRLILLDEPAAGLNPSERREFIDIIRRVYESGVDIFMIEHNMDVVMNLSHDCLLYTSNSWWKRAGYTLKRENSMIIFWRICRSTKS